MAPTWAVPGLFYQVQVVIAGIDITKIEKGEYKKVLFTRRFRSSIYASYTKDSDAFD